MLPKLQAHKLNNPPPQSPATKLSPGALPQSQSPESRLPDIAKKSQLPTIFEAEHVEKDSLKAVYSSDRTDVPLLPIVNNSPSQTKNELRPSERVEQDAAIRSRQAGAESGSDLSASRAVPHYAVAQDRTPIWSERDRPGRFTTPKNPYKQNLDIAPKVQSTATRYSSPAKYGRGSDLLPGALTLESSWSRSPRHGAGHGQEPQHLAPLSLSSIAPATSLKQASKLSCYLSAVFTSLHHALRLPPPNSAVFFA